MKALVSITFLALLFGCGAGNGEHDSAGSDETGLALIFDTVNETREWGDCAISDLGCITLSFQYPKWNDSLAAASKINQIILKNLFGNLRDSIGSITELGDYYIAEYKQYLLQQPNDNGGWQIEKSLNIEFADALILSLRNESFENRGGAHPILNLSLRSYFIEDGKRIVLEDLFTGNYRDALESLCRTQLKQVLEANLSFNSGKERITQIVNSFVLKDHFLLTETAFLFFVTEKETSSLGSDMIEFAVPFEQIAQLGIVNPNGRLAGLLSKPIL